MRQILSLPESLVEQLEDIESARLELVQELRHKSRDEVSQGEDEG